MLETTEAKRGIEMSETSLSVKELIEKLKAEAQGMRNLFENTAGEHGDVYEIHGLEKAIRLIERWTK